MRICRAELVNEKTRHIQLQGLRMAYFSAYFLFHAAGMGLASPVGWAFQALGQLQNINETDKLPLGNGAAVNAGCPKADPRLFFGIASNSGTIAENHTGGLSKLQQMPCKPVAFSMWMYYNLKRTI